MAAAKRARRHRVHGHELRVSSAGKLFYPQLAVVA